MRRLKWTTANKILSLVQVLEFQSEVGVSILLNQFLKTGYGLSVYQAKVMFHIGTGMNCLFSILGATISDSFSTSYRTILYSYLPLILGTSLMTLFSINGFMAEYGQLPLWCYVLGSLLIALGLGGVKPCLFTITGDQFLPDEKDQLDLLFSINFIFISIAAVPMVYFLPYLKDKLTCFDKECYPMSYGICLILVILSFLCFLSGRSQYRILPTQGQFLPSRVIQVLTGGDKKLSDSDLEFKAEVNQFVKVCLVSLSLSLHFLLEEQTLSEWMNQFELTNRHILGIYVPTEAYSIMIFILSIILAPTLSLYILPTLQRRNLNLSLETRLLIGYLLMIIAFLLSTLLESYLPIYSTMAIRSQGIVTTCPGCLSGTWQLPQFLIAALSNTLLFPNFTTFLYQNSPPPFRTTSSSLFFLSISLANFYIILLEFPLNYLYPNSPVSRQLIYLILSSIGWLICYKLMIKYFYLDSDKLVYQPLTNLDDLSLSPRDSSDY